MLRRTTFALFIATISAGAALSCGGMAAADFASRLLGPPFRIDAIAAALAAAAFSLAGLARLAARCPGGRGDFSLAGAPRAAVVASWLFLGALAGMAAGPLGAAARYGRAGTFWLAVGSAAVALVLSIVFAACTRDRIAVAAPRASAARRLPRIHPALALASLLLAAGVAAEAVAWSRIACVFFGADAITRPQLAACAAACAALGAYAGARISRRAAFPAAYGAVAAAASGAMSALPLRWLLPSVAMANTALRSTSASFASFLALRFVSFAAICGATSFFAAAALALALAAAERNDPEWEPGDPPSPALLAQWAAPAALGAAAALCFAPHAVMDYGVFGVVRFASLPALGAALAVGLAPSHAYKAEKRRAAFLLVPATLAAAGVAAACSLALVRSPESPLLADGSFMRALRYGGTVFGPNGEILFHADGLLRSATICRAKDSSIEMDLNGKSEMTTPGDLPNQLLVAHLPMLFHPSPKRVAVAGVGSGIAVGAIAAYPVEAVECVDDEPAVDEAARRFVGPNMPLFIDSRVTRSTGDVRAFLRSRPQAFDVVVSQPSNPWISGMDLRFTRGYFADAAGALRPGGIFCGWIEGYAASFESLSGVVAAFLEVFPHAMLWCGQPCEYLIVGSREPFDLPADRLASRLAFPEVAKSLAPIGVKSPASLAESFVASTEDLRAMSLGARPSEDFTTPIAYATARSMRDPANPGLTMAGVECYRSVSIPWLSRGSLDEDAFEALEGAARTNVAARGEATVARSLAFTGEREKGFDHARAAARLNPGDFFIASMARDLGEEGAYAMTIRDYRLAALRYNELLSIQTNSVVAQLGAGAAEGFLGNNESAYWHYVRAAALAPDNAEVRMALAGAAWLVGDPAESIRQYKTVLESNPRNIQALHNLAVVCANSPEPHRDLAAATRFAEQACALDGWKDPRIMATLADIYSRSGRNVDAIKLRNRLRSSAGQGK